MSTYITQSRLPWGWDFPVAVRQLLAILFLELGKSVCVLLSARRSHIQERKSWQCFMVAFLTKVVDQCHIITFLLMFFFSLSQSMGITERIRTSAVLYHDNACTDQHTPGDGLGVESDALHKRHRTFLFRSQPSIVENLLLCLLMARNVGGLVLRLRASGNTRIVYFVFSVRHFCSCSSPFSHLGVGRNQEEEKPWYSKG